MLDIIYNGLDVILPFAWINHVFMKNAFFSSIDDYTTFGNFKHYGCQQSYGNFFLIH